MASKFDRGDYERRVWPLCAAGRRERMRLAMRAGMLLGCIASSCDARAAEATVASICERLALEARVAVCSSDLGAVRALGATVLNPCDDTDGSCEEWGSQGGCESDPHLVLDLCCATCHPTHAEHSGVSQLYLYPNMPVLRPSAGETPPGCRREQAMSLELAGTGSRESCSAPHGQPVSTLAPHVHNSSDTAAEAIDDGPVGSGLRAFEACMDADLRMAGAAKLEGDGLEAWPKGEQAARCQALGRAALDVARAALEGARTREARNQLLRWVTNSRAALR